MQKHAREGVYIWKNMKEASKMKKTEAGKRGGMRYIVLTKCFKDDKNTII